MGKFPVLRPFRSSLSPWELFKVLHGNKDRSFFLDTAGSSATGPSYSYLGAKPFAELTLDAKGLFLKQEGDTQKRYPVSKLEYLLRSILKKYGYPQNPKRPFFTGGAVGFLGYEMAAHFEKKVKFRKKPAPQTPLLYFGFYRDVIVYDHQKKIYYEINPSPPTRLGNALVGRSNLKTVILSEAKDLDPSASPQDDALNKVRSNNTNFLVHRFRPEISEAHFEKMIRRAKNYIGAGDIYQANLSQRFSFDFNGSPVSLYEKLREINPSPFAAYIRLGDLKLISSSPERLVSKRGRICETKPIAGTKPVGYSQKDFKLNPKERAEHIMLVDLERNDLGRVCDYRSVRVKELMKIEKYSHVMHLVSTITGQLVRRRTHWDILKAVFPGGTVTGCPKIRCMEIIDELEPVGRGLYTGSIGYMGFDGDLDFNIVIRTLILKKKKGWLQVGAGIVQDSDPRLEYEETLHKGEALVEALVQASVESKRGQTPFGFKMENHIPLHSFSENAIGIFETMRAYNGKIFRLEEHLERLEESAKTVGTILPLNRSMLRKKIQDDLKKYGNESISIRVTIHGNDIQIIYNSRKIPDALYKNGVDLKTSPVKRNHPNAVPSQVKTSDYQNALFATLEPADDAYEWLMLDANGYVTEVRVGNIFIVCRGAPAPTLITPSTPGILNGVTRRVVIECARNAGLAVSERPLMRHEVYNADEAFLTNTSWEILPIRSLDQRKIGLCLPGKRTTLLQQLYRKKVQKECH